MTRVFSLLSIIICTVAWQAIAQMQPMTTSAGTPLPAAGPVGVAGLTNGYVPDDSYKLRVGDTVSFQILEDQVLKLQIAPTSLVVADSGELDVPYIGRVMAVDKTSKQLGEEIKKALEKDYYKKATVVLSLNVANRLLGRVYIWGQVHNQGAIDLMVNEQLTVGKAILRAGGFADFANKRKVKVVRANANPNGQKQSFDLDMVSILENGNIDQDIVLQPNDLIIVPTRLINF
jgi:protein involved in polysaccharide export with SLBB domain